MFSVGSTPHTLKVGSNKKSHPNCGITTESSSLFLGFLMKRRVSCVVISPFTFYSYIRVANWKSQASKHIKRQSDIKKCFKEAKVDRMWTLKATWQTPMPFLMSGTHATAAADSTAVASVSALVTIAQMGGYGLCTGKRWANLHRTQR